MLSSEVTREEKRKGEEMQHLVLKSKEDSQSSGWKGRERKCNTSCSNPKVDDEDVSSRYGISTTSDEQMKSSLTQ